MSAHMAYNALTRTGGHIGPPLQRATRIAVIQRYSEGSISSHEANLHVAISESPTEEMKNSYVDEK